MFSTTCRCISMCLLLFMSWCLCLLYNYKSETTFVIKYIIISVKASFTKSHCNVSSFDCKFFLFNTCFYLNLMMSCKEVHSFAFELMFFVWMGATLNDWYNTILPGTQQTTIYSPQAVIWSFKSPVVGVTTPFFLGSVIFLFFNIAKIHVSYWISRSYLTGVVAAQLRWHRSTMNENQRMSQVLSRDQQFCLRRIWRMEPK